MGYPGYELNQYQRDAVKTMSPHNRGEKGLMINALGIAGEGGEVADYIKKVCGHGHPLDKEKIKKELGDVLWYVAVMAQELDISMSEIAEGNIEKLKKRYPEGFSTERNLSRTAEPEPVGPDSFPGSDEGSHYMNSKQGLSPSEHTIVAPQGRMVERYMAPMQRAEFMGKEGNIRDHKEDDTRLVIITDDGKNHSVLKSEEGIKWHRIPNPTPESGYMDKHSVGGLYVLSQEMLLPGTMATVWKLTGILDNGPGPAMVELENTATKAQISIQQDYLFSSYHYLGHMGHEVAWEIGATYRYNGTNYRLSNQDEATGSVYMEPMADAINGLCGIWVRMDRITPLLWKQLK
jgi:NTP pyrophosphatase (non-canonical NTP hydrolase)